MHEKLSVFEQRVFVTQSDHSFGSKVFEQSMLFCKRPGCQSTDFAVALPPTENHHAIHQQREYRKQNTTEKNAGAKFKSVHSRIGFHERSPTGFEVTTVDSDDRPSHHAPEQKGAYKAEKLQSPSRRELAIDGPFEYRSRLVLQLIDSGEPHMQTCVRFVLLGLLSLESIDAPVKRILDGLQAIFHLPIQSLANPLLQFPLDASRLADVLRPSQEGTKDRWDAPGQRKDETVPCSGGVAEKR